MSLHRTRKQRHGITLVEMLVVVAIIAILAALILPAITGAKDRGQIAYCANNLRSIGQGIMMYAEEHNDFFPAISRNGNTEIWDMDILPYVGGARDAFVCPADTQRESANPGAPRTYAANGGISYGTNTYPFGEYNGVPLRSGDLDFNLGDIILVGERPMGLDATAHYDITVGSRGYLGQYPFCGLDSIPGSMHRKNRGCNYLFGSMSVRYFHTNDIAFAGTTNFWTYHTN